MTHTGPADHEGPRAVTIVVAGSRTGTRPDHLAMALWDVILQVPPGSTITLRHGACPRGVDAHTAAFHADQASWAAHLGYRLLEEPRPADWDHCAPDCPTRDHRWTKKPGDVDHPGLLDDYCPGAGPRRNRDQLIAPGADLCVAVLAPCTRPRCARPRPHGTHGATSCATFAEAAGINTTRLPVWRHA